MKKIITLAASVLFVASAFAQFNRDDNKFDDDKKRDAVYRDNNRHYDDNRVHVYNNWERDREITRVNREYDHKIRSVRNRFFMNRFKKEAIICSLQEDRKREIRMIYVKYSRRGNHHDDHHGKNW